ncbi:MAG: ribonuclease P protein component [Jatrophihabitans sp.]
MRRSADFTSVFRGGTRFRAGNIVVHYRAAQSGVGAPLVGLVVGKVVGNSVVRHQVSR